jgi:hypothetical protein
MRVIRDAIIIGLAVRGTLWVFDHPGGVLTVVAVAVGAYLALRFLLWFVPGFARGFRRGIRGDDEVARKELAGRLAADMRQVARRQT